jgi:hypothetical protein
MDFLAQEDPPEFDCSPARQLIHRNAALPVVCYQKSCMDADAGFVLCRRYGKARPEWRAVLAHSVRLESMARQFTDHPGDALNSAPTPLELIQTD